jgi:hypothetical protein
VSKLGVIATLVRKDCGYESDQKQVEDMFIGNKYEVENISVGQSHTNVYLKGHPVSFNSIHFEFTDDNGNPVDIFKDARFSPYIQYKMA